MEYVNLVTKPCACLEKIHAFVRTETAAGRPEPYQGSVIKCDCGVSWILRSGRFDDEWHVYSRP